ncbi:MAG: hypothetical protein HKN25_12700 [Pyrinomonadaceae bacterium]|nr:hypothetical protein [Pyrinomonadaceae bacterium]
MGFDIWARGNTGRKGKFFHYSKKNRVDRGDFSLPSLLSMVPASSGVGGVVNKAFVAGINKGTTAGVFKIAKMHSIRMVTTGIAALHAQDKSGTVSLYCKDKGLIVHTLSNVKFYLNSPDPERDFLRKITPALIKTDLNNFGALAQIGIVLSKYFAKLNSSATPHLQIDLTH